MTSQNPHEDSSDVKRNIEKTYRSVREGGLRALFVPEAPTCDGLEMQHL